MRKIRLSLSVSVLALLLLGCVRSFNPFYTPDAIVDLPEANGTWVMLGEKNEPKNQKPWLFEEDRIVTYSEKGASGDLEVVYFRVGTNLFADTMAGSPDDRVMSDWWTIHVLPFHLLCRMDISSNRLEFRPFNYDWLIGALNDGEVTLPSLSIEKNGGLFFTATPSEWRAFLEKYGASENAFPTSHPYVLIRSSPADSMPAP